MVTPKNILISRTDSIGDVVLTLPVCVWLKKQFPTCKITFLGNTYTRPILECLPEIDTILEWKELEKLPFEQQIQTIQQLQIDTCIHVFPKKEIAKLMKKAGVANRIGTSHRLFHLLTCNIRPNFTRKNSDLHESQLNFKLLEPLGLKNVPSLVEIKNSLVAFTPKEQVLPLELTTTEKVILHPKSQGSALEWPIEKYVALALQLAEQGKTVYFTGTQKEGDLFRLYIPQHTNIHDVTGVFSLSQFITFISKCDTIVACSTGPLHIGAVLGLKAIGIFSQTRPIHPQRWQPIGKNTRVITNPNESTEGKISTEFVKEISIEKVLEMI